MFGLFHKKPKRWGGKFRIDEKTYGDGSVYYVVMEYRSPGPDWYDAFSKTIHITDADSAILAADGLYKKALIKTKYGVVE